MKYMRYGKTVQDITIAAGSVLRAGDGLPCLIARMGREQN